MRVPGVIKITPNGEPALFAFPEYPAVFHGDGYLYQIPWSPGRLMLERVVPDGRKSNFVNTAIDPRIARTPGRDEGSLLAITSGPNSFLYISDGASIWKISSQGSVLTVAENITVSDCPGDLPVELPKPHIRSLSVDAAGNIYAAAIGCERYCGFHHQVNQPSCYAPNTRGRPVQLPLGKTASMLWSMTTRWRKILQMGARVSASSS